MSVQHGCRQQADQEVPHANDEPEQTSADRRDGGKDRRREKRDRGGAVREKEGGGRQETLHTELNSYLTRFSFLSTSYRGSCCVQPLKPPPKKTPQTRQRRSKVKRWSAHRECGILFFRAECPASSLLRTPKPPPLRRKSHDPPTPLFTHSDRKFVFPTNCRRRRGDEMEDRWNKGRTDGN